MRLLMMGVDLEEESQHGANWDVYNDVFVPQPTGRQIRAWERAPVPAHAPRLQGQKIWKRTGLRTHTLQDRENHEDAQQELAKGGAGARKRARVIGTKENIGNARWMEDLSSKEEEFGFGMGELMGTEDNVRGRGIEELQYVPRKRTNTDHVITPRKPLKETTTNVPGLTGRTQGKVPLKPPQVATGSPIRRRKSTRKSFRRSMRGETEKIQEDSVVVLAKDTQCTEDANELALAAMGSQVPENYAERLETRPEPPPNLTEPLLETKNKEQSPQPVESTKALGLSTQSFEPTVGSQPVLMKSIENDEGLALPVNTPKPYRRRSLRKGIRRSMKIRAGSTKLEDATPELTSHEVIPRATGEVEVPIQPSIDKVVAAQVKSDLSVDSEAPEVETTSQPFIMSASPSPSSIGGESVAFAGSNKTAAIAEGQSTQFAEPRDFAASNIMADTQESRFVSEEMDVDDSTQLGAGSDESSPIILLPDCEMELIQSSLRSDDSVEDDEALEPFTILTPDAETLAAMVTESSEILNEISTPDPTTTELTETILQNAPSTTYDHDDTDMLRNFLTRVKANKAAKAAAPRKRSLPHSPLRIPLGEDDTDLSPSAPKSEADEFDVSIPSASPTRKRRRRDPVLEDEMTQPQSVRRSVRTRLPVKPPAPGAPSFIPVRRFGQDADTTLTLQKSEDKKLATLTRVNSRRNKGALSVKQVLAQKEQEKEDPVAKQRVLKEMFEEKLSKEKRENKGRNVTWAEELAQFQIMSGRKIKVKKEDEKEKEKINVRPEGQKKNAVRLDMRNKIALGMAKNGTPAPKRRKGKP
ncbi:hypothetical protein B7494_g6380 [Chlorociboria aeruginascens]|nr:hypothetical protein B7494_g6380 [Chlorociboria aeruginascens]